MFAVVRSLWRSVSADVELSEKSPYLGGARGMLSQNELVGEVVLTASSSARASLFAGYRPSIGPHLALAASCESIRYAVPFFPTESFRLSLS